MHKTLLNLRNNTNFRVKLNRFLSSACENVVFTPKTTKKLSVSSTFNRQTKVLDINCDTGDGDGGGGKNRLNFYCCGPTVYDHSHLGHAISYIRCDITNRVLETYLNQNIAFAMNITDIDDKIIAKSIQLDSNWKDISEEYFESFKNDISALNIRHPDVYLKVTDKIDVITAYIHQIYERGFAYISPETGDINFDYEKFIKTFKIRNERNSPTPVDSSSSLKSSGKRSYKDFALWKPWKDSKNEPKWECKLDNNISVDGRPGNCLMLASLFLPSSSFYCFFPSFVLFSSSLCSVFTFFCSYFRTIPGRYFFFFLSSLPFFCVFKSSPPG